MKPIPNTSNYFWVGEGTPTATASVPVGATYFNQTTGASFRFVGGGGWVALPDSLSDVTFAAEDLTTEQVGHYLYLSSVDAAAGGTALVATFLGA